MRRLGLLFQRELAAYALSPVTWMVATLAWGLTGLVYYGLVIPGAQTAQGQVDLPYMIWSGSLQAIYIQILLVPLLTMRLLSEERRSGTYEMLVTAPVRDHEIVLAKFLAAFVVNSLLWTVIPLYAIVAKAAGGSPDFGPVGTAYVAIVGTGALFVAIGLFASSLTRHQLMAGFLGVILILAVLYLHQLVPESFEGLKRILEVGNLLKQTEESARGLLDLVHVTYQLAFTAVFLVFTTRVVESRKWA